MKIIYLSIFLLSICKFTISFDFPPLPESWRLPIDNIIKGIKKENWLSNYIFLAKPRVKPGESWNVRVEATWTGPSLIDSSFLNYLSLVFDPINKNLDYFWYGDKFMTVSEYNHATKKIIFTPQNPEKFMIASTTLLGVYTGMQFSLKIENYVMPGMGLSVNTRVNRDVEITCSDGIFCNGEERYVKLCKGFKCVNAKYGPCDDPKGNPCASYECIESQRECKSFPIGGSACSICNSTGLPPKPNCSEIGYECGWDADRTVYCGSCPDKNLVCSKGKCLSVSSLGDGSCFKPHQLYNQSLIIPPNGLSQFTVYGDLSLPQYIDNVSPVCNPTPVPDVVYVFTIQSPVLMGIEVQMLKADGTVDQMDTVLALTNESCDPLPLFSFCSDDSTPPGGLSSRIKGKISNGTYKLIASAYSSNTVNLDRFQLRVKFYPDCLPQCDGNTKCGPDGCGGECGTCQNGEVCDLESSQCRADPCVPDCTYTKNNETLPRVCGDDKCGGVCGSCNVINQEMCILETGQCVKVEVCNNFLPYCSSKPSPDMVNPYCGSDCKWHDLDELIGDFVPNNSSHVLPSIEFNWFQINSKSCSLSIGCYQNSGNRLLMKFNTFVANVGKAAFYPAPAQQNPLVYDWSTCLSNYYFNGYASFYLYDLNRTVVSTGGLRAYCLEDVLAVQFGDEIKCKSTYDCTNMGQQPGWADIYRNIIDCNGLDITDIEKEKWYIYEVCSNTERKLPEGSNSNNCKRFTVYIPELPFQLDKPAWIYSKILQERNLNFNSGPQIQLEPGDEL